MRDLRGERELSGRYLAGDESEFESTGHHRCVAAKAEPCGSFQRGIGAEDCHVPPRTLFPQDPSEGCIKVAEVFGSADTHAIGRVCDDPSRAEGWLDRGDGPAREFDTVHNACSPGILPGRLDRSPVAVRG